jgi:hypothetical protein
MYNCFQGVILKFPFKNSLSKGFIFSSDLLMHAISGYYTELPYYCSDAVSMHVDPICWCA